MFLTGPARQPLSACRIVAPTYAARSWFSHRAVQIVAALGAGGMGEVYRARDTRLKRDVALKFLPEAVAADPERLARFEREAQALAALKHPHIATIHGIEEGGGFRALVLELAEGETLADRIARGSVPIPDAVAIARQIVDALEAAHEQGIVHRDLKPANIQVAPDGTVKVLDFGLARIVGSQDGASSGISFDSSMSPTITSPALVTGQSVLMGTAAYMAPEQARGKPADKRADIWAFGVVLYEMLTGTRAFSGETVTEVAGAVIHKDLDLSAFPKARPNRCVCCCGAVCRRTRDSEYATWGTFDSFLTGHSIRPRRMSLHKDIPSRSRVIAMAAVAALFAAALAAVVVWIIARPKPVARYPVHVSVPAPATGTIERLAVALSPDGRHLAFIAPDSGENRLWVYSFADGQSRVVAPRDSVRFAPLWSPDSQSLAFLSEGGLEEGRHIRWPYTVNRRTEELRGRELDRRRCHPDCGDRWSEGRRGANSGVRRPTGTNHGAEYRPRRELSRSSDGAARWTSLPVHPRVGRSECRGHLHRRHRRRARRSKSNATDAGLVRGDLRRR